MLRKQEIQKATFEKKLNEIAAMLHVMKEAAAKNTYTATTSELDFKNIITNKDINFTYIRVRENLNNIDKDNSPEDSKNDYPRSYPGYNFLLERTEYICNPDNIYKILQKHNLNTGEHLKDVIAAVNSLITAIQTKNTYAYSGSRYFFEILKSIEIVLNSYEPLKTSQVLTKKISEVNEFLHSAIYARTLYSSEAKITDNIVTRNITISFNSLIITNHYLQKIYSEHGINLSERIISNLETVHLRSNSDNLEIIEEHIQNEITRKNKEVKTIVVQGSRQAGCNFNKLPTALISTISFMTKPGCKIKDELKDVDTEYKFQNTLKNKIGPT